MAKSSLLLVEVRVGRDAEELASAALFDLESTGIVTLEETLESIRLGAYFAARLNPEEIARAVEAAFAGAGRLAELLWLAISEVPDQDWMQEWKEGFEPLEIGPRLVVAPS